MPNPIASMKMVTTIKGMVRAGVTCSLPRLSLAAPILPSSVGD